MYLSVLPSLPLLLFLFLCFPWFHRFICYICLLFSLGFNWFLCFVFLSSFLPLFPFLFFKLLLLSLFPSLPLQSLRIRLPLLFLLHFLSLYALVPLLSLLSMLRLVSFLPLLFSQNHLHYLFLPLSTLAEVHTSSASSADLLLSSLFSFSRQPSVIPSFFASVLLSYLTHPHFTVPFLLMPITQKRYKNKRDWVLTPAITTTTKRVVVERAVKKCNITLFGRRQPAHCCHILRLALIVFEER